MAEKSKVTRITAKDDTPKQAKAATQTAKKTRVKKTPKVKAVKLSRAGKKAKKAQKPLSKHWYVRIFQRIGRYVMGSWTELKQVRWPTRKATWSLTIAVLLFSAFFVVVIMGLDYVFNALFELIISN